MTIRGFGKWLAMGAVFTALAAQAAPAQEDGAPQKAGKPINVGEVLEGELGVMRLRHGKGNQPETFFQVTSEPRRLPPPSGLCNLETGPETFQLVTANTAQASQLKGLLGKQVAVKVDEVACAQETDQMSEAVVTKWSLVRR